MAGAVATLARLTFTEARRRRILTAALLFGSAFVLLFAVGLHFISSEIRAHGTRVDQALLLPLVVVAALYASNFLVVMTSVLVAVDTLTGEIDSGTIETLCTKPVPRAAVVLGKWLGSRDLSSRIRRHFARSTKRPSRVSTRIRSPDST